MYFRSYTCLTEHILVLRILYLHYGSYTFITEHVFILRILYLCEDTRRYDKSEQIRIVSHTRSDQTYAGTDISPVAPLSRPDPLGRIRTESGMPQKSLNHSKSYLCGSDYKIEQAHKHLYLTKSIYNEGIQAFSK